MSNVNGHPSIVVINGSSRKNGDTSKVLEYLNDYLSFQNIFLGDFNIQYFDYTFNNQDDDFNQLLENYVLNADCIILASPVYWYSISAQLKTFMDRLSDLLIIRKDDGRKLRGKSMLSISVNQEDTVNECFYKPLELSAEYLGIKYLGHFHVGISQDKLLNQAQLEEISTLF